MKNFLLKTLWVSVMLFGCLSMVQADNITVLWPLMKGTANATTAELSVDKVVSTSSFELGTNLAYNTTSTQTVGGAAFSQIRPLVSTANAKSPTDGDIVKFSVTPKKGIKFTPTRISFNAAKLGTSGGTIDLLYRTGENENVSLATTLNPNRNNATPPYTHYSYDITGVEASENTFCLLVGIYNLASSKAIALDSVKIEGVYSGTAVEVPTYQLTTSLSDVAAGTITTSPVADKYDEGTSIKLSVNENFGYHFAGWKAPNGDIVSTENPYAFVISQDTTLQAVFDKKKVYALNLSMTNGARTN